jgi:murein DD-endopeptidase MepM/ murein hydrolase activator NlpD
LSEEAVGNAINYILSEMEAGRFTARHIYCLVKDFQAGQAALSLDGKPGPLTVARIEREYPRLFAKPETAGKFLSCPLPYLKAGANPQARKPVITSAFRTDSRPDHDGVDLFYRWEPGDQPAFVGDGGCEGKNSDGSPKWVVPYGVHALAAADGVIQIAGPSPTGYRVWIDHGNGLRSGYFHLEAISGWQSGQRIMRGAAIGPVGHNPALRNGKPVADGRHLHFEVSLVEKYEPQDPKRYLKEW